MALLLHFHSGENLENIYVRVKDWTPNTYTVQLITAPNNIRERTFTAPVSTREECYAHLRTQGEYAGAIDI